MNGILREEQGIYDPNVEMPKARQRVAPVLSSLSDLLAKQIDPAEITGELQRLAREARPKAVNIPTGNRDLEVESVLTKEIPPLLTLVTNVMMLGVPSEQITSALGKKFLGK